MAKKYITDKLSAKTASSGITYSGDAIFIGGPNASFSFNTSQGTTGEFSVNIDGDDFFTVNTQTGVVEAGDIAGLMDGHYLKVDPSSILLSWKYGQDDLVTFNENSTVSLYGTGANNASGAELHILKGQSNEVSGKLKLNYTTQYLDLEYEDPGATNIFRLYRDYTYTSQPIRIGADAAANELDDYEEGDWTPQMGGYFGGFTLNSYTTQLGKYIKIGRVVHLFFDVEFTGAVTSGMVNLVYLFGLPFAPSDTSGFAGGSIGVRYKKNIDFIISGQYDSLVGMSRLGTVGSTQMYFTMDNGTGTNTLRVNSLTGSNTDSMALEGCITYRTTS